MTATQFILLSMLAQTIVQLVFAILYYVIIKIVKISKKKKYDILHLNDLEDRVFSLEMSGIGIKVTKEDILGKESFEKDGK